MNSYDPWRVMRSSPTASQMVVPAPFYGHPFYREFVGAEPPAAEPRGDLTAAVAPVVAPATGGFSARVDLDAKQILHAEIVIDGKTYKASIDMAPAIAAMMTKFAQYHTSLHDGSAPAPHLAKISGDHMIGAVDQIVGAASDQLVGSLVDHHVSVACGSFLDDIGHALKGAGGDLLGAVQSTVKAMKGPIIAAASSAALAIPGVGPVVGPMAAQLVGPLIDQAASLGKPHPAVAAAQEAAKTDPQAAQALDVAKTVAAHAIAAHHVIATTKAAAAGDPVAQQQVAQVTADAERGDPAAHAVAPLVTHTLENSIASRRRQQRGPGGEHGGPETYPEAAIRTAARDYQRYQQQGGAPVPALGYLRRAQGGKHNHKVFFFHTPDEAQAWYAALPPHVYAALFDGRNLGAPIAENFGA